MELTNYNVNIGHNDFRTQIMTIEELLLRFDETDATSSVSSFRRPTQAQASRIIESVLLGMPQPMLYIDDTSKERVVVEGAEHIFAYNLFCKKELTLSSLYFKKKQYEGRTFQSLSPLAQSNILNTKITVNVLNPGLSRHERFGIYLCLKSRIDATSLQWCRTKIFPSEYQPVRDFARSLSLTKRTETLEFVICYLLVGKYYEKFLNGGEATPIDAAANLIMEKIYDGGYDADIYAEFRPLIGYYMQQERHGVLQPRLAALYMSVLYHLEHECGDRKKAMRYFAEESKNFLSILRNDDNAETFCRLITEILTKLR